MSITDELREWAVNHRAELDMGHLYPAMIEGIADRIDKAYQKAEDEWRAKNGDMWLKGYNVCHAELMEGHPVIVADLENAGWVRLPVDADGVPIHVGDVLTDGECRFKVFELAEFVDGSWRVHNVNGNSWEACDVTHYHEPTVEDVLTEFGIDWEHESDCEDRDALLKEYAAKLRLADEKE